MAVATSSYDISNIPKEIWKFDVYAHTLICERKGNCEYNYCYDRFVTLENDAVTSGACSRPMQCLLR